MRDNHNRYPLIKIRSKNELAKRISAKTFLFPQSLELINDCLKNFDGYWRDHTRMSDPKENKWVRDSSYTPLGYLQKRIDRKILKPYDGLLPCFIHGGISGKNIKTAALSLLGQENKRIMLKIDMRRFFEHISYDDVVCLFHNKFDCSYKASRIIASLCCVPEGKKGVCQDNLTIGRGFATSARMAVWANLDLFLKISWIVEKHLKNYEPKIAVYVDDICITASRASVQKMIDLYFKILKIIEKPDCRLEINQKKTRIIDYMNREYDLDGTFKGYAHYGALGLIFGRNKLYVGNKTRTKISRLKQRRSAAPLTNGQKRQLRGLQQFNSYISRKDRSEDKITPK